MRSETVAVMFTDIEGFTARTGRQTRAENERMLALHDALLMPVVAGHDGRRIKTIGDAYLVVFRSTTAALRCGAAIQDRLAAFNARADEGERLRVRVAINAGEVRLTPGDVFGEPVNVCARLEGLTDAGEVRFTEAVWLSCERSAVDAEELGVHALKGVDEPVKLFRLRRGADPLVPYQGAALAALKLPAPDPATLVQRFERARKLRLLAGFGGAGVALVLSIGLASILQRDPAAALVSRALAGEHEAVKGELEALPAGKLSEAERACVEAAVQQGGKSFRRAFRGWRACAEADAKVALRLGVDPLVAALADEDCGVRTDAAELLGAWKATDAASALRAVAGKEEPRKEGILGLPIGRGCGAGDAARAALQAMGE